MKAPKPIRVAIYRPGLEPTAQEIIPTVATFQEIVGGYFEYLPLHPTGLAVYCNEDGKHKRLPVNRALMSDGTLRAFDDGILIHGDDVQVCDILVGTFLVFRADGAPLDEEHGLTDEDLARLGVKA